MNPHVQNPIRFEKNVGDPEGPREFFFDPHAGTLGTLYTYEDVSMRGDFENHPSLNGMIPIHENVKSAMLQHYWQATVAERTQIRRDYEYDDDELVPENTPPPADMDRSEGRQTFNGERVSQSEREKFEQGVPPDAHPHVSQDPPSIETANGLPVIPVDLAEYIQNRDIIRAQDIALKVLIPMVQTQLAPEAPEHEILRVLIDEIEATKGNIYDEA